MKVVFCTPVLGKPHEAYVKALEDSVPVLDAAGIEHTTIFEVNCPYISHARATMTRKALDTKPDVIVYLDYDLSWEPVDLVKLIQTDAEVCAGLYRFKLDEEKYMGTLYTLPDGRPILREDGCLSAEWVPAGFLKVTAGAINTLMGKFPELCYGPRWHPSFDLFNHGAHEGLWYGEDYAFSRRWHECKKPLWVVPDLNIVHHSPEKAYPGNYHEFLLRQPGGSNEGK